MPKNSGGRPGGPQLHALVLVRHLCLALSVVGAMAYGADFLSRDPLPVRPVAATAVSAATAVLAVMAGRRSRLRIVLVLAASAFAGLALAQAPGGDEAVYAAVALMLAAGVCTIRAWPEVRALFGQGRARALIARQEHYAALMAGELHDEVLQLLALTRRQLGAAVVSEDPQALDRAARDAGDRLDEQAMILKGIIATLHPVTLRGLGLTSTVRSLAARVAAGNGLEVTVTVAEEHAAVADEQTTLAAYRIVQEALTNVVKHARAERVRVCLDYGYDRLVVTVRDDGIGLPAALGRRASGYGMQGMRWRCEAYGGTFSATSASASAATCAPASSVSSVPSSGCRPGTVVRATLPLRSRP